MVEPPLRKRLKAKYHKSRFSEQQFLPLDIVDEQITEDAIKAELSRKTPDRFRNRTLFSQVVEQAKKVFAVLVIIGEAQAIEALLQEGITDKHLPLSRRGDDENDDVLVSHDGKTFPSFSQWEDDIRVDEFLDKQWIVQAPVLEYSSDELKFSNKHAMPFLAAIEVTHTRFSSVWKTNIHPAHQRGFPMVEGGVQVAVKEFTTAAEFQQEKQNLDEIRGIRHPHLIRHLVTYETNSHYYVVFPWASGGNLSNLWQRDNSMERTEKLVLWSLRQMIGIASALEALHNVNCRHGDIKPENILHFIHDEEETLVLADVGVSRVHIHATKDRKGGTTTRATTPAYEAPEALTDNKSPRARKYDMWSLGCILLEYVIWLLEDLEAVKRFRDARDGPDHEFYFLSNNKAEIHPTVRTTFRTLREHTRCRNGTAIEALIDLVAENLLQVDIDSRDPAEKVVQKLREIVSAAEQNPSHLLNKVDPAPPKLYFLTRKASIAYESSSSVIFEEPSSVD